jgi:hypothetical protein
MTTVGNWFEKDMPDAQQYSNLLGRHKMALEMGASARADEFVLKMAEILELHHEGKGDNTLPTTPEGSVDLPALPQVTWGEIDWRDLTPHTAGPTPERDDPEPESESNFLVMSDERVVLLLELFSRLGQLERVVENLTPEQNAYYLNVTVRHLRRTKRAQF